MRPVLEILLIDDLADDRELICHLLGRHMDDIRITCEDNKTKVVRLLKQKSFDLIIIDYFLQGYTGLDLIDDIRALKGFDVPIIMITADESEEVAMKSIQHGVDDFILKTLKGIRELPDIIHRTIQRADIHKIKFTSENTVINTGDIFQNVVENAAELIFTIWPDGTFVNFNEATLQALGINRGDVGVKNFVEFVDTSQRGQFKSALNQLFSNSKSVHVDLTLWSRTGDKIDITGSGHAHMANGKVVATNWIFRNVTSQKYMESLMWDDYQQYSGIFDYIPVAVMLSDHRGVILQANTAAAALTGYQSHELQGIHIGEITHPDDIRISLEHHKKLMTGELDQYTIEKRYRHKSGKYVWVELSGSLVKNSKGEPLYAIAHIKDITELKAFEELLGKLARDLTRVKGEYIFDRLSARLIELLQSDYVFISSINNNEVQTVLFRDRIKSISDSGFSFPSELLEELSADDELIITNKLTRKGIRITALDRQFTTDMVAIPLRNDQGTAIGILGTIYKNATHNHSMKTAILRIAGTRIAEQLQIQ